MHKSFYSQMGLAGWPRLVVLIWLVVAGLLPGRAQAQTTAPDGGTLSPTTSAVCLGFNSGTLTLTGYNGTIIKYQANSGSGYVDIANTTTSYIFSNLSQTTSFRVVVQSPTAGLVASTVATVTVNQPPTATINSQGPTRFCQQGTIYLVAGPSGNYTYQFLRNGIDIAGATNQVYSATITASGSYSVRVTEATGCSAVSASVQVQVQPQNVVTLNTTTPTTFCQGGSVRLNANVNGAGSANYTYQFLRNGVQIPGATSSNYTATTSGNYQVVVDNPATCSATSSTVAVTVLPPTNSSVSYASPTFCQNAGTTPMPTVATSGGAFSVAPTGLSLNPNSGALNLSLSQPGTYTVTYTAGTSCPSSSGTTVVITAPPVATFTYNGGNRCTGTSGTLTPALASGASAGTFSATPTGLSLNTSTGEINVAQSQPGTYTVTNTIAPTNGCAMVSATASVVLTVQPVATLAAGGPTTFCQGGSVVLTASGGAAGATYQFLNNGLVITGATTSTYTASAGGSYSVIITNPGGCASTSAATTVTVNPLTTATFSYANTSYCQSNAAVAPTVTGTAGGVFSAGSGLSLDANTGTITPGTSTAGTYTVTYSVSGPCPSTGTTNVTITALPVAMLAAGGPTTFCQGGSVVLTASGGAIGATYQFLNNGQAIAGATTSTYTASMGGNYSVTVANAVGCANTSVVTTVTVNPLTTATFSYANTALCQSSAATTPTVTGTAGGTFSAGSGLSLDANTGTITPGTSTAGTYTVTYSVSGPCPSTATTNVTLTNPAVATFTYGASTYCVGGTNPNAVLGSGASAGTFSASPTGLGLNAATGTINLSQSQPGTYIVTNSIAAGSGCPAATASTQVMISAQPVATLLASGPTTFCQGGSVVLTANGGAAGATYQFLNSGQPISGANAATYTATTSGSFSVVVTNAGVCSATSAATTVTVNPTAMPTVSYSAATLCQNTSTAPATVSISGGSFSASGTGLVLNTSTGTINPAQSQSGTYTVTYTGGSPCPGSGTTTVTIAPVSSAAFAYAGGSTFCPTSTTNPTPTVTGTMGGTFTAPSGLVIDPTTGTINLQTSTAGSYAVTYSVAGPCPASSSLMVTLTSTPVATFAYPTGSLCAGSTGSLAPTFTGGGSAGTFTSSTPGLALNATTGTVDLSQSQAGTYTVTNTIAASGACTTVSATAPLTINALPAATRVAGGPTTFCAGGSVVLTAPAGTGFTYQFLNNNQPIGSATAASYTATTSGSYAVAVTNASGCTSTSPVTTVVVNPATTATFSYAAASYCRNSAVAATATVTGTTGGTFTAPTGLSVNAATGAFTPSASTAGTYTVTYTVGGPCPSTGMTSVTITTPAVATFSYANASYCATGTASAILAAGSTAGTFTSTTGLSVNAATGDINLTTSTPGTYTVTNTVAANGGCGAIPATVSLTINAQPAQPTLTANGALLTASTAPGSTYQFYLAGTAIAGATSPTYTATQSGSYTVVVTSAAGCASLPSIPLAVVVSATRASLAGVELTVFPNPTTGRITLTMEGIHSLTRLTVYNALGQEVLVGSLAATATTRELDLTPLAIGVYVLKATTPEGTVTRRLVRQ